MKKLVLLLIIGLSGIDVYAQEKVKPIQDHEVWAGVVLKKELTKKLTLNLDNQVRISDNLNGVRSNFVELGLKYDLNKIFSVRGQYRYTFRNNTRNTERISLDAMAKWKFKPAKLQFKYRARFQNTMVVYSGQHLTTFRNRFTVQYKISKKWRTYVEYESFYRFNTRNEFRRNRGTLGAKYRINKEIQLKGFLQIDQDINIRIPQRRTTLGLILTYNL